MDASQIEGCIVERYIWLTCDLLISSFTILWQLQRRTISQRAAQSDTLLLDEHVSVSDTQLTANAMRDDQLYPLRHSVSDLKLTCITQHYAADLATLVPVLDC